MNRLLLALLMIVSLCLAGPKGKKPQPPPTGSRADLSGIQSWAIQLQGADINELVAADYDAVVIDYSRDGTDA
ncbi:MAG: hypothetical protein ACYTGK_07830, partial [Planctomycetota bacterium]